MGRDQDGEVGSRAPGSDVVGPSRSSAGTSDATRSRWRAIRDAAGATVGVVLGIAPHVLHHIGLLAGTALITGAGGNALFYAVGLLFSVPMLIRLHRHFGTPWAPVIAVAVFSGLFFLSAFVIGPAIAGPDERPVPPSPTEPSSGPTADHDEHHD